MSETHKITLIKRNDYSPEVILSADNAPLTTKKAPDRKHILVIGGGVIGLMTAWILLDKGYKVTIIAEHWAYTRDFYESRLTSQIAGALWEFPPGGCGLTELVEDKDGQTRLEHYEEWALQTYEFYNLFSKVPDEIYKSEFGGAFTILNQFFYYPLDGETKQGEEDYKKYNVIKGHATSKPPRIDKFEKKDDQGRNELFKKANVAPSWQSRLKDAYVHNAPIVNTDRAMVFLMSLLKDKGATMETRVIDTTLQDEGSRLQSEYGVDAIINATGLGAGKLANDIDVYPVRGAIKRIDNKRRNDFRHVAEAYLVPAQKDLNNEPAPVVFLVPRSDEILIVGSIIQRYNDQLNLDDDSPEVDIMWKRATTFLDGLSDAKSIPEYPLAQGLRPFTEKNAKVRAQIYPGNVKVVHNYGHGGSGWTLVVGCARTGVFLLEQLLKGTKAQDANDIVYKKKN